MDKQELISMIDYTLLKPTATKDDITTFCKETIEHGFKTVFVNPYYVAHAHALLAGHGVKLRQDFRLVELQQIQRWKKQKKPSVMVLKKLIC